MSIDWNATDKFIWSYVLTACGQGTCGGMGQTDTFEEAYAEVQYWAESGGYDCHITGPGGVLVYECEGCA